jgi:hypothetical protein
MDLSLVKLGLLLEKRVIESLLRLKLLLEEKMAGFLMKLGLKHVEGRNSPQSGSPIFPLQVTNRG